MVLNFCHCHLKLLLIGFEDFVKLVWSFVIVIGLFHTLICSLRSFICSLLQRSCRPYRSFMQHIRLSLLPRGNFVPILLCFLITVHYVIFVSPVLRKWLSNILQDILLCILFVCYLAFNGLYIGTIMSKNLLKPQVTHPAFSLVFETLIFHFSKTLHIFDQEWFTAFFKNLTHFWPRVIS